MLSRLPTLVSSALLVAMQIQSMVPSEYAICNEDWVPGLGLLARLRGFFSWKGRFEHFGKRVESYRPRFSEEQIKKNASSIQKKGKRIVLPDSQPIIQDAPVSRKEKGPEEMGHIGANDACMEASVLVHDHGKTKIGGLVKVGEVIVTQVAGNVLDVIPSGQVPVLVAFGGSSSGQIFHGPDKYIGPGSFKDSCVENVLIFGAKGLSLLKV
ncbi:hypothetical protein Q3G72_014656 [Acer saccharum]|nr:hypothetical protein Q3G72_014656 [Acer saccharum]